MDPLLTLWSRAYTAPQKHDAAISILADNARARIAGQCEPFTDEETGKALAYLEENGGY